VLEYSLRHPTHGQVRRANELRNQDIVITSGGVKSIWFRH
jgi:hypothetical protein